MEFDLKLVATGAALAVGLGYAAVTLTRPAAVKVPDSYSYLVPGSEDLSKGLGAIYRAPHSKDKLISGFPTGESTGYEVFQRALKLNPAGAFLGKRKIIGKNAKGEPKAGDFEWQTYEEVNARVVAFAAGLMALNLIPEVQGSAETGPMRLLALFMKNRPEWIISEQACFRQSATTVPMYDTLGPDTVEMIFNETELTTVVAAPGCIPALLDCKDKCPTFKNIIYVDELPAEQIAKVKGLGLNIYSFAEVEEKGKANPVPAKPPTPDMISTFCYTSGTTGKSKGALLSHRSLVSTAAGVLAMDVVLGPGDRHLSYLPLAHVFERAACTVVIYGGAQIGFFQGETTRLPDDLTTLRPTLFPSVPRLLNRFYDKIMAGVQQKGGITAKMFFMGYHAKQQGLKQGYLKHRLWDKLVFSKIAYKLGLNHCKYLISGSAPIAPHVIEFLRIILSCPVVEGFGQTETAAGDTVQHLQDYSVGNVGFPLANNEIRLVSVPDMGYNITDRIHGADERTGNPGIPCMGRGEICFRGHNTFKGYYKMPDKTAETLDAEGWVHSGDIGIWTVKGQLKIVDRKKNIFKLAQGEYIAPEKIENVYTKSAVIAQAFVYGDSFQHQLVAIIVPDAETVGHFCKEHNLPAASMADLCKDPKFKAAVVEEMAKQRKEAKLFGFEHAAEIYLEPNPFSVENDLLTPTFKLKRDVAKKYYQTQIDDMYSKLEGVAGVKGLKQ